MYDEPDVWIGIELRFELQGEVEMKIRVGFGVEKTWAGVEIVVEIVGEIWYSRGLGGVGVGAGAGAGAGPGPGPGPGPGVGRDEE